MALLPLSKVLPSFGALADFLRSSLLVSQCPLP